MQTKIKDILTEREYETLSLIAKGLDNSEICENLCIALSTFKSNIAHIYQKLHLSVPKTELKCTSVQRVRAALIYQKGYIDE